MKPILIDLPLPILTDRLLLKPPTPGDGVCLNEAIIETYDQLRDTMPWAQHKPTINDSEEFVRLAAANWILKNDTEPYLPLFIFDRSTNLFLGAIGFHHIKWHVPVCEIGYWLRASYQKKGIMTEAANALTRYAFDELLMERVEIRCDITNASSKKIPERLGFIREAVLKKHRRNIDGNISDTLLYARYDKKELPPLEVTW